METSKMDRLKFLVGETLYYCQALEHDLKIIYACSQTRNLNQVIAETHDLSKKNLGDILQLLTSEGSLDHEGIRTLNEVRVIRNYLAHEVFTEVAYLEPSKRDATYQRVYARVLNDHDRILRVMKEVEQSRIAFVRRISN
jgi:hypothetical protein